MDNLKYRADIDGLRAIAVLSVVAYHAFPLLVPGGFIGVDIFFVISGYLISSIILGSLAKDSFSFREFYVRRIKRIFPALIVVLIACWAVGWFTLMPNEFQQLGKHTAGGAGFISNLLFWKEAGYFDGEAEMKPLLHLWSLGIEEQFYIIWPLLLVLGWKQKSKFVMMMAGLLAASFAFNVYEVRHDLIAAFYSPLTRLWELSLGGGLAYLLLFYTGATRQSLGWLLLRCASLAGYGALPGLGLLGAAMFLLNARYSFPGWWALLPACGTVLLISSGRDAWVNREVLSSPWLVYVGRISFPLYLWHWPILAFARILGSGAITAEVRVVAIISSFVLAALTYRLVEMPVRFGSPRIAMVPALAFTMSIVLCAGSLTYAMGGFESRVPGLVSVPGTIRNGDSMKLMSQYLRHNDQSVDPELRYGQCRLKPEDGPARYTKDCIDQAKAGERPKPLLLVWGDSFAGSLFPGVRQALAENFRLAEFAHSACPPVLNDLSRGRVCAQNNSFVMGEVARLAPDIAILFAVWNKYSQSWNPGDYRADRLSRTVSELKAAGVGRIIIVGPAPQWTINLPRNLLNIYRSDLLHRVPMRTAFGLQTTPQTVDIALAKVFESRNDATYVSALGAFCDGDGCLTRVNDSVSGITTLDYGHLTVAAGEYLARKLVLSP